MRLRTQFIRYATVGLVSNGLIYIAYLGLTGLGMGHKLAMTILYLGGILLTFFLNRRWSFRHDGRRKRAFARYLAAYVGFYFVNLAGLFLFVDRAGFPHQWVQAAMIAVCAAGLFLAQRFWVFSAGSGMIRPT
jgi:putative flippase GtrA